MIGGGLGAAAATGVLIAVRAAPPLRPVRLHDRIAPYLGDATVTSKLLARPSATSAPFVVIRRLFGPVLSEAANLIDRAVGGAPSVRRRLAGVGPGGTVEEFRVEQIVWGSIGLLTATVGTVLLTRLYGAVNPVLVGLAAVLGLVGGVLGRDWT